MDELVKNKKNQKPFLRKDRYIDGVISSIQQNIVNHEDKTKIELGAIIEKKLRENWRGDIDFSFKKDFSIKVTETEYLENEQYYNLLNDDEIESATSEGQSSLIIQTFISQLLKYCRDSKEKNDLFITGINAPLIIDSPFGKLDPHYRITAAENVAEAVDQAVYLISSSQGPEEVINEIKSKVGATYMCVQHLNKGKAEGLKGRKEEDKTDFSFQGKTYKAFEFNCDTKKIVTQKII